MVTAITAFSAVVSQRWTGFNSPDSEFYGSLALFGSDVTDRAIEPAYTWTRLGYIAPVRALVTTLGPWAGFEVWRILLIALIVASTYAVVQIAGRSRVLAAGLALLVSLNSVLLSFLGNTYLTGTILSATFVLIALAVSLLGSAAHRGRGPLGSPRWVTALASGAVAGWLLMLNPYSLILGVALWVSVRLVVLVRIGTDRWRRLLVDAVAAAGGFGVVFVGFLITGRAIFPGRDWWGTYREWNSRLDYTVFIGDSTTWMRDSALLLIVVALAASAAAVLTHPRHRWAWAALALSVANVVITVVLLVLLPGPWLEAPTYVAKLWPAALFSLVLVYTSCSPGTRENVNPHVRVLVVGFVVTTIGVLWVGRFDGVLDYRVALAIAALMGVLIVGATIATRSRWNAVIAGLVVLSVAVTFTGAQVLQNGRGLLGTYGQVPFRAAFVDFSYRDQMASKVALQEWLLDRTSLDDRIALWTDVDRLAADAAGMQLWGGYNIFTTQSVLDREGTSRLEELRPSVVAMYAPDSAQINGLYESLPPWSLPSDLECTSEPYLGVGTGEVILCLTRLTWVG